MFLVEPKLFWELDEGLRALHEEYCLEQADSEGAKAWHLEMVDQRWQREQEEEEKRKMEEEEQEEASDFDPTALGFSSPKRPRLNSEF